MHELSIAMGIVDIAEEEGSRRGARVCAVHLKLGVLSGVVEAALQSSYEMAAHGTQVEGSRLLIESVPAIVFCPGCREQRTLISIQNFCCPKCGTPTSEVIHGKELEVVALEIEQ
jgi:hydrogenase nickel incorporation protein HypA/HybF